MNNIKIGTAIDGDLTIATTTPMIVLDSASVQDGILRFQENGVKAAELYHDGSLHRLRMVLYDGAGATENEFQLRSDLAYCDKAILTGAAQHPNANAFTRRDYVDDNFLALSGGVLTGPLYGDSNIEAKGDMKVGDGTATNVNPQIIMNSSSGGNPSVILQRVGTQTAQITGFTSDLELKAGTTTLKIYDVANVAVFNTGVRGEDYSHPDAFRTHTWLEDRYALRTSPTVQNSITLTGAGSVTNYISAGGTDGSALLEYENNDIRSALVYRTPIGATPSVDIGVLRLRRYDVYTGLPTSEMSFGSGSISTTVPIIAPDSTTASTLTTRGYVDTTFVDLTTAQDIAGVKTFTNNLNVSTTSATSVNIFSAGTNTTNINLRDATQIQAQILGLAERAILRRPDSGDGITDLTCRSTYAESNKEFRVAAGTDNASAVRQDELAQYLGKNSTAVTTVSFQPPVNNDWRFYSTDTSSNILRFYNHDGSSNILESWINAGPNTITVRKFNSVGGNTEFVVGNDTILANKDMQLSAPGSNANSVLTYTTGVTVDTIQDIAGLKTFTNNITVTRTDDTNATLVIDAPVGRHPYLQLNADGVGRATLAAFSSNFFLGKQGGASLVLRDTSATVDQNFYVQYSGSTNIVLDSTSSNRNNILFRQAGAGVGYIYGENVSVALAHTHTTGGSETNFIMYDDYIIANKPMRAATPTVASELTTKGYVDDNTNVVQQNNGYSMVMPSAAGTAGQQLQVISVSGTVLTMGWV